MFFFLINVVILTFKMSIFNSHVSVSSSSVWWLSRFKESKVLGVSSQFNMRSCDTWSFFSRACSANPGEARGVHQGPQHWQQRINERRKGIIERFQWNSAKSPSINLPHDFYHYRRIYLNFQCDQLILLSTSLVALKYILVWKQLRTGLSKIQ